MVPLMAEFSLVGYTDADYTRYFEVCYHFIRDHVKKSHVIPEFVLTNYQLANSLRNFK